MEVPRAAGQRDAALVLIADDLDDAAGSLSTLRTAPACCGALRLSSPERALPLLVPPNAARLISTSLLDDLFFALQLCTTASLVRLRLPSPCFLCACVRRRRRRSLVLHCATTTAAGSHQEASGLCGLPGNFVEWLPELRRLVGHRSKE